MTFLGGRDWSFSYSTYALKGAALYNRLRVPLWFVAVLPALPTAWLWYIDRRHLGQCAKCGYDLAGLAPGSMCPECGEPSPITSLAASQE